MWSALLRSSSFNLHIYCRQFCRTPIIELPSLIRKEKVTWENCVTQTTRKKLYATKRDVQLEHCIVPKVSISPQNHKMTWINNLLRSTTPQNLMSLSSVKVVIKSFQDFTLYVNIETLNTECKTDHEQEMWMWNTYWEMVRIRCWEKSCVLVNISRWSSNLERRDTKYSITQRNSQRNNRERETWSFFQQFEICNRSEFRF